VPVRPGGGGLVPYTETDFRADHLGLDPAQFVDLLALVGKARIFGQITIS